MRRLQTPFPIIEGIGIFVGVAAWHLLTAGELEFFSSSLIGAGAAAILYCGRCWKAASNRKPR